MLLTTSAGVWWLPTGAAGGPHHLGRADLSAADIFPRRLSGRTLARRALHGICRRRSYGETRVPVRALAGLQPLEVWKGSGVQTVEHRGGPPLDLCLQAVNRALGLTRVVRSLGDAVLSARLGLRRGHALPWTMSDVDWRDRNAHRRDATPPPFALGMGWQGIHWIGSSGTSSVIRFRWLTYAMHAP